MTLFEVSNAGRITRTLMMVLITGLPAVMTFALLPSSGSTHHLSNSAVNSTVTLPADGSGDSSEALSLVEEGWHSWTVDAVETAPNWCCNKWRGKQAVGDACDLDSRSYGYSHSSNDAVTDEMQIYAKVVDGRTDAIRTYGASCGVVSQTNVIDHGKIASSISLDWLANQLNGQERIFTSALAAVAVHKSTQAQRLLRSSAHRDQPLEKRKQAIFWMGQVRAQQSKDDLDRFMTTDDVEEVREHAVFSVSQSDLINRLPLIERVARNDSSAKIRGQAWFWMSQTGDAAAGPRILLGMKSESNRKVLKQAVFALSQLPDEDAVDGLIRVIEEPGYARDVRKQALFWMAQSDSGRAVDYLANVLDR